MVDKLLEASYRRNKQRIEKGIIKIMKEGVSLEEAINLINTSEIPELVKSIRICKGMSLEMKHEINKQRSGYYPE